MAPISTSLGLHPVHLAIAIISCVIFMAILPFLAAAIWIIWGNAWGLMVSDRPRYLKGEKLRKEWNKAALAEQNRQERVKDIIRSMIVCPLLF